MSNSGENNGAHQDVLESTGKNLRKLRVLHGMTQEQLALAVNLNIRTLQRIEAGKMNMLVTTALRIIDALGCSPNELMQPHIEAETQR